ncbi:MAG TPA: Shedu anti-phage system protein SduA domain-containing protein [Streptomyces sp.]
MVTFRSSRTLWTMVKRAQDLTEHASVRERIDVVLRIMGGPGGAYGRGRPLVNALKDVAQEAVLCEDFEFAQRFQRFAAYAGGEMFLEILKMYYDEEEQRRTEEYMRRMAALGVTRAIAVLDVLRRDNPDATASDARDLFQGIAQSIDHLGLGTSGGGIQLSTKEIWRLQHLGHMDVVLRGLPRVVPTESADLLNRILADADEEFLSQVLALKARRTALEALQVVVGDPKSSEGTIHDHLKNQEWIFGGAYVAELARRQYTPDTILDIPLLRADGSLHVVELKRANVEKLVIRRSGHLMLGAPPHQAVSQAQNYLRTLDENRQAILEKHGVDTRRASATVVIGHSQYVTRGITPHEVAETLRTYNAHDSRIQVITYETLLDTAARMLALSSAR